MYTCRSWGCRRDRRGTRRPCSCRSVGRCRLGIERGTGQSRERTRGDRWCTAYPSQRTRGTARCTTGSWWACRQRCLLGNWCSRLIQRAAGHQGSPYMLWPTRNRKCTMGHTASRCTDWLQRSLMGRPSSTASRRAARAGRRRCTG